MKILTFLILFVPFFINAQPIEPRRYVVKNWNLDDGLPQSTVNTILQTHDGYIWLTTFGGLVRFNGVDFTVFNRSNSLGMLNDRVTYLFEDRDYGLWVSSEKGVILYKNGLFKTYTEKDGFPDGISCWIKQDKNGTIWASTINSIYKFIDERFVVQPPIHNDELRRKAIGGEGDFWFANEKVVSCVIDGKPVQCFDMVAQTRAVVMDVEADEKGTIWIATDSDGLFKFSDNNFVHFTVKDGLCTNTLRVIFIDEEGKVWVTGIGGISCIDPKDNDSIYNITRDEGLTDPDVINMTQDDEGNYWVGTVTGGLTRLRKSIITVYNEKQGLLNSKLLSICFKKNGTLIIGTNAGGIYELTKGKISYSYLNKYLRSLIVWSIFEDSKKRIWIGAGDIILVEGNKVRYFKPKKKEEFSWVFSIYEDREGTIWFGTNTGLFYFLNDKMEEFTTENNSPIKDARCIYEDGERNLWVGTTNGLYKIKGNNIDYLGSIKGPGTSYIRAIYQDKEGTMWFGSYGGGIIRLKENKYDVITAKDGLFDNIVSHIVEDDSGYFWMGCNRGISRVAKKELNDFADGKINKVNVTSFGKAEGMMTVETNGGFQPSAVKDAGGKIYFPTVNGLAVVDPHKIFVNTKIPEVHIEKFLIEGKEYNNVLKETVSIPFDSADVQIEYTALSFRDIKKVKFKYKIEGYDKDWVDAGTRRSAYYTKLPPGKNEFTVIASNNSNIWNTKGASVSFIIMPPFWMTWWFRTIIIITFFSVGPIYYRRIQVLKKEKQQHEKFSKELIMSQEQERSRIAAELHDSLGQNILIMKNHALLALEALSSDPAVEKHLSELSNEASETLDEVRKISYNLRPYQIDRFGLTESLRSMLKDLSAASLLNIKYAIDNIDGIIPKEFEINVYRLVQESLNNVIKHANAAAVNVEIRNNENEIVITVEDDGSGFDVEAVQSVENKIGGIGISGMIERAKISGALLNIKSIPGTGTKVILTFPKS